MIYILYFIKTFKIMLLGSLFLNILACSWVHISKSCPYHDFIEINYACMYVCMLQSLFIIKS